MKMLKWYVSWTEYHNICVDAENEEDAKEIAMALSEEETMSGIEINEVSREDDK